MNKIFELIKKIKSCTTMPELDAIRMEIVTATKGFEARETLQNAFVRQKNKLNRIPLSERTW